MWFNKRKYIPSSVSAKRSDDCIQSGREVAILRVNSQVLHVRTLQRVKSEESIKYGGVHSAPNPHEKIVAILQQKDSVGR